MRKYTRRNHRDVKPLYTEGEKCYICGSPLTAPCRYCRARTMCCSCGDLQARQFLSLNHPLFDRLLAQNGGQLGNQPEVKES